MLIKVNLLPARLKVIRANIANFLFVCVLIFTFCLVGTIGTNIYYSSEISDKQEKTRFLKKENKKLSKLVEDIKNIDKLRTVVKGKIGIIDLLKNGRYHTFAKLSEIASSKPQKTWIKEIKDTGNTIIIDGYSISTDEVSGFMRELESKDVFQSVTLKLVKRQIVDGDIEISNFSMVITPRFKESDIVSNIDTSLDKKKKRRKKKSRRGANK